MLNNKYIISYKEIIYNVKTFIDMKKAKDLRCSVQMAGSVLCLINEV